MYPNTHFNAHDDILFFKSNNRRASQQTTTHYKVKSNIFYSSMDTICNSVFHHFTSRHL